jgi:hypothetical protein
MKVTTVEIIKVSRSMEEWATIANMVKILENIYYDENPDSQKNIEKQWEKAGVNIDMGGMLIALETLRDLETTNLDTE